MGLTSWKNSPDGLIYKYDVVVAKNYLICFQFMQKMKQKEDTSLNDWIKATDERKVTFYENVNNMQ